MPLRSPDRLTSRLDKNLPMQTSTPSTPLPATGRKPRYRLAVNAYDRTTTFILAALILVSLIVFGLLVVFLTTRTFPAIESIPVSPVEATSSTANQGVAAELEPPGVEEAPDLHEPLLQDTLDALTVAASAKQASLADENLQADDLSSKGEGLGDARLAGPGGDGVVERVPRWKRWKIRFQPNSPEEFARWLDFHRIEIGVLGRNNVVYYASNLSSDTPRTRTNPDPKSEQRGYTSAADGPMPELTVQLARKANISRHGTITLLFYSFDVENTLYQLEQEQAGNRNVNTIRETVFVVVRDGQDYGFQVVEQKFF